MPFPFFVFFFLRTWKGFAVNVLLACSHMTKWGVKDWDAIIIMGCQGEKQPLHMTWAHWNVEVESRLGSLCGFWADLVMLNHCMARPNLPFSCGNCTYAIFLVHVKQMTNHIKFTPPYPLSRQLEAGTWCQWALLWYHQGFYFSFLFSG